MKKSVILITVLLFSVIICSMLVACSDSHEHELQHFEVKKPTCTEKGNIEYWYCADCGKYFSDGAASTEITVDNTVIAASGHMYQNHVCIKCGATEDGYIEASLEYILLGDDTYEVSGIGTVTDTNLAIPEMYNGKAVTSIGERAFYNCSNLTSITVPDSVTSIGYMAFWGCSGLTSMTVPLVGSGSSSNTHFGYIFGALSYSNNSSYIPSSLKEVFITGGTSIWNYAFA